MTDDEPVSGLRLEGPSKVLSATLVLMSPVMGKRRWRFSAQELQDLEHNRTNIVRLCELVIEDDRQLEGSIFETHAY